jgi:hypothetical protein
MALDICKYKATRPDLHAAAPSAAARPHPARGGRRERAGARTVKQILGRQKYGTAA